MKEGDTEENIQGDTSKFSKLLVPNAATLVYSSDVATNASYIDYTVGDVYRATDSEGMGARIDRVEQILGIGQRDEKLESKYPELKQAGDDYHESINDIFDDIRARNRMASAPYEELRRHCEIMEKLKQNNE